MDIRRIEALEVQIERLKFAFAAAGTAVEMAMSSESDSVDGWLMNAAAVLDPESKFLKGCDDWASDEATGEGE